MKLKAVTEHGLTNRECFEPVETPSPALADLDVARNWFRNCRDSHQNCNGAYRTPLGSFVSPSRLVELTDDGVKVISSETAAKPLQYITLSHMWGKYPALQLRLQSSQLDKFSQGIPDKELPHIFRKGVHIARYLHIKYLWIDALCILQTSDDPHDIEASKLDWEKEGIKMAEIYSNAVCNISFLYPPDDDRKISYDPRALTPCMIRPDLGTDAGIVVIPQPYRDPGIRSWEYWRWIEPSSWPLSSRAWAYQEYLLNRRTLFYGHNNFLWECAEQYCDQSLGSIKAPEPSKTYSPLESDVIKNHIRLASNANMISTEVQLFKTWAGYISEYRQRALTVHSDRIVAFVGIAQAFTETHDLTYLAGHFWEHMPHTLMWFCHHDQNCEAFEDRLIGVPSWSWFSARVPISPKKRDPWNIRFEPSLGTSDRIDMLARMIKYQWADLEPNVTPGMAFTSFTGLHITLEAALFPATTVRYQSNEGVKLFCEDIATLYIDPLIDNDTNEDIFDYRPDTYDHNDTFAQKTEVLVAVLIQEYSLRSRCIESYGLVLVPVAGSTSWRREGWWSIKRSIAILPDQQRKRFSESYQDHLEEITLV